MPTTFFVLELYMLPFKLLRGVFDDDELMEIHALMEEKELRLRRPLLTRTHPVKDEETGSDAEEDDDDQPIVFT